MYLKLLDLLEIDLDSVGYGVGHVRTYVSNTKVGLSGWNYPPGVLSWDLGLFISLAAVL